MLVCPPHLACRKIFAICRRRWRIRDLSNEIRCRCFCNTVYQDAQKWDLEEDVEAHTEAEENTLSVMKPQTLLFFVEPDSREVWLKLQTGLANHAHNLRPDVHQSG